MSHKSYFGIEGNFFLPKDFFVTGDMEKVENQKKKILEIEALGLDMTLRQQQELQKLQKEKIVSKNKYGFKVLLIHNRHDLAMNMFSWHRTFEDHTFLYNIDTKAASLILLSEDSVQIDFAGMGDVFVPLDMPFCITDSDDVQEMIVEVIKECKLSITLLDRGDDDYGYVEDGCNRTLEHVVHENGEFVKVIKETP